MKKRITTTTETPTPETPAPALDWISPLAEAGIRAAKEDADRQARDAALATENRNAPYIARARGPLEAALAVLPGLIEYQAASGPILAAARAMGLETGSGSPVQKADASSVIRQIHEASKKLAELEGGTVNDPGAHLAEILMATGSADKQLAFYRVHLTTLVAKMEEVAAARAAHPISEGPPLEAPPPHPPAPPGGSGAITEFNVFDFGKEN